MNFVALKMLTGDKAKYLGLIFTIAFCTFLLENQTSIFAGILKRTGSQIADVTDAEIWVMDPKTEYFEQTKALKDTDLTRVRGVDGVEWAVKLYKGNPVARTIAGKFAACFCLGLDDATLAGAPRKMLLGSWERLREPDSIVIDNAGYILLFPDEPLELDRERQGRHSLHPDNHSGLVDDDPRRFGFHNLRHSLASFLIRTRTDPKTVQTLLRHSDVKLTLQFYSHAVSRDRMVAAGKMLTAILSYAPDKNGLTAD